MRSFLRYATKTHFIKITKNMIKQSNNQKQKKVINTGATKNNKVHGYMANVVKKAKEDLKKIETEIDSLEKTNN